MREKNSRQKIYVAMSGGVDSSLSAAMLAEDGYDVRGVFIKSWSPDWLPCTWRDERRDAMRVAAKLGIPFETLDGSDVYKRDVADYMIAEYTAGRTPNPDVMCNSRVKFGLFFDYAMKNSADYIATGHYAQVKKLNVKDGKLNLFAGEDRNKDQSYFLWKLTQEILGKTLFPVGSMQKLEVRSQALARGLLVAEKKDSQGVCFLGPVDMSEFLSHYIDVLPGDVLDESGKIVGGHNGAILYTVGQRHGFEVVTKTSDSGPWYVVGKDVEKNTITVVESYKERKDLGVTEVKLIDTNWIGADPEEGKKYSARIRYRQPLQPCTVEGVQISKVKSQKVIFDEPQLGVASGQSCVLYDLHPSDEQESAECLGGGVIL